jgi:alkylhydroperoxidase family enzyme
MRRFTMVIGVTLVCGLTMVPRTVSAAEGDSATQVQRFERLKGPRIKGPLCPQESEVCKTYNVYIQLFRKPTLVPDREKELLILRTAWLNRGDQQWGRHSVYGRDSGLTNDDIKRVMAGPSAPGWSKFDAALLKAADELHMSAFISEPTWQALGEKFNDQQKVEVVLIVGDYTQMAMYQNALGSQRREGDEPIPNDGK